MQKARRQHTKCLRPLVSTRFQGLFTPLLAVLFTFPSRYWFTIGLLGVFSLAGWCRRIQTGFHLPRPTQDTDTSAKITCTGFSPSTIGLPMPFQFFLLPMSQSYNPNVAVTTLVWASPRSLATTNGITIVFFSSGYLDVSVLRVCLLSDDWSSTSRVVPFGYLRINSYVPIPAAFRSLSRPSSSLRA